MNAKLFTECDLSIDQRRGMADHWRQWERRRRTLSAMVDTAHSHLLQLPMHANLPAALSSQLRVLCGSPHSTPLSAQQTADSHMHDVDAQSEALLRSQMHAVHASHVDLSPERIKPSGDIPRFLGNDPRDIERASAAMGALRTMHVQDRNMFVENLDAHMPGVLVNATQVRPSDQFPMLMLCAVCCSQCAVCRSAACATAAHIA